MRDSELTERPGKGWTPWAKGPGDHDIEKIWWMAIRLHHPLLNTTTYWNGSELVGLEHWGYRQEKWCMRLKPADWQPLPEVYRRAREAEKQRRQRVERRCVEATASRQETHGPHTVLNSGQG